MSREIIVGITGASGAVYARRLIEELASYRDVVLHVIASSAGRYVYEFEIGEDISKDLPDGVRFYQAGDFTAPFVSGSHRFNAMVVVPCTMATMAAIASGTGRNIIHRTADVCLKERRLLILVPRETPLNMVHIENMLKCARMGAVILPAMPAFYHKPESLNDLVDFIVARIMEHLGIQNDLIKPWPSVISDPS
ncbi:UbiX family flavin prenyltransferase [Thermodesulforhabdus norvegica]|uniref:Flavin prenyltransferase UbiX n=1 Tax=Thermodesulforhabdus norvegica TaxID=39841 RepID=A0A1I4UME5_9BACT|nr:UbiX family flavin prenyltransferase [Thermodesulforhabdus norvegica]SFM90081.1 4-hydroxy-3-polyprenylbenzoate decarboxylase [Thermodesulforhabdus norvegica]